MTKYFDWEPRDWVYKLATKAEQSKIVKRNNGIDNGFKPPVIKNVISAPHVKQTKTKNTIHVDLIASSFDVDVSPKSKTISTKRRTKKTAAQQDASLTWIASAVKAIRRVAKKNYQFTTDDVWKSLNEMHVSDNRAMGAAMRQATKECICYATSQTLPSLRKQSHRRPLTVWNSLICR